MLFDLCQELLAGDTRGSKCFQCRRKKVVGAAEWAVLGFFLTMTIVVSVALENKYSYIFFIYLFSWLVCCATELGVFAKKQILKRTQFGPLLAPTTTEPPSVQADRRFVLMVKSALLVLLKSAARQSSWLRTESRYFQTSAEDIHFCEILMTKCIKRICDLFDYALLYKFTLYLLTFLLVIFWGANRVSLCGVVVFVLGLWSRGREINSSSGLFQVANTWMVDCLHTGKPSRYIANIKVSLLSFSAHLW